MYLGSIYKTIGNEFCPFKNKVSEDKEKLIENLTIEANTHIAGNYNIESPQWTKTMAHNERMEVYHLECKLINNIKFFISITPVEVI